MILFLGGSRPSDTTFSSNVVSLTIGSQFSGNGFSCNCHAALKRTSHKNMSNHQGSFCTAKRGKNRS